MANTHVRRLTPRRGFTLLEVIVVVTIIALLATLVAPRLLGNIGRAKVRIAESDVASIAQQVSLWAADNGYEVPPEDFELSQLTEGDAPLLDAEDLVDPWGNPYFIVIPPEHNHDFDVMCLGADGERGGDGKNADIVN